VRPSPKTSGARDAPMTSSPRLRIVRLALGPPRDGALAASGRCAAPGPPGSCSRRRLPRSARDPLPPGERRHPRARRRDPRGAGVSQPDQPGARRDVHLPAAPRRLGLGLRHDRQRAAGGGLGARGQRGPQHLRGHRRPHARPGPRRVHGGQPVQGAGVPDSRERRPDRGAALHPDRRLPERHHPLPLSPPHRRAAGAHHGGLHPQRHPRRERPHPRGVLAHAPHRHHPPRRPPGHRRLRAGQRRPRSRLRPLLHPRRQRRRDERAHPPRGRARTATS
jgi:hypothetical protein